MNITKNILLVEPIFPTKTKSKNHKNFLPIGLLKLASFYKSKGHTVELVRGCEIPKKFKNPDKIYVTTLFTYWSKYVWDAVEFYRTQYPQPQKTQIWLGGIYASLHFDNEEFLKKCRKYNVRRFKGVHKGSEKLFPDYTQVMENGNSIDYQIVHASRGCFQKCRFCGTWIIEPEFEGIENITKKIEPGLELGLKNLVFYDNNFFYNPNIEDILNELIELKKKRKIRWCESQSGFDGRILLKKPELANLIKKAGFRYPRIAWDWEYEKWREIKKQIKIIEKAGYNSKDIYIFMIYNWEFDFEEMEKKRIKCWNWNVQISDCRNRPLTQLYDYYKPLSDQSDGNDYHINPNWTDAEIKQFRRNVRRQNICIRHNFPYHSRILETKKISKEEYQNIKELPLPKLRKILPDVWKPSKITYPVITSKTSTKRPHP